MDSKVGASDTDTSPNNPFENDSLPCVVLSSLSSKPTPVVVRTREEETVIGDCAHLPHLPKHSSHHPNGGPFRTYWDRNGHETRLETFPALFQHWVAGEYLKEPYRTALERIEAPFFIAVRQMDARGINFDKYLVCSPIGILIDIASAHC